MPTTRKPVKTAARTPAVRKTAAAPPDTPVVEAPVPDDAVSEPTAAQELQQRITDLLTVSEDDMVASLTQRVGELENQRIANGLVITRLLNRILELDPADPVATKERTKREKENQK